MKEYWHKVVKTLRHHGRQAGIVMRGARWDVFPVRSERPMLVGLYSSLDGGHDPAFIGELRKAGIDPIHLQPAWDGIPVSLAHVSRIDSHPSVLVHEKLAEYPANLSRQRGWLNES